MKKLIGFILALSLVLALAACGTSKTENPDASEQGQQSETDGTTGAEKDSASAETDVSSLEGLSGQALFDKALSMIAPDAENQSYRIEMETTDFSGQKATTITTMAGDNMRVETQSADMDSVYIYNADEGATYTYDNTTKQGMRMLDDGGDFDTDYEEDYGGESIEDEDYGSVTSAKLGEFLGRTVLIAVFDSNEEGGNVGIEVWYDLKTGAALKTATSQNGTVLYEAAATKFDAGFKADKSLFVPPEDVQIVDAFSGY